MINLITWIAAIIFVEATVEIEVSSQLFTGFRSRIVHVKWIGWYLNGLFSCGYCLSVWVSAVAALFIQGSIITPSHCFLSEFTQCVMPFMIADYIFKIFIIHRLANAWHELIHRWLEKIPWILAFNKIEYSNTIDMLELGEQDDAAKTTEPTDKQIAAQ